MAEKPLYTFTSHIQGKNAKVSIYPDRVDWSRAGLSGGKLLAAGLTLGASAIVTGVRHSSTEMIPVKSITSVATKKGAVNNTVVSVITSGATIDFRVSHKEAKIVQDTLNRLILAGPAAAAPVAAAEPVAAAPDITEQLQKLGALRDGGILTEEEFAAKKADLLARL